MKKRDKKQQAKIEKITAKRAAYEEARKQKFKAAKLHTAADSRSS
jgi:hypothetical protein